MTEGATGSVPAEFTISLTGPSAKPVSVAYSTSDASAAQPGDYSAGLRDASPSAPGRRPRRSQSTVNGDSLDEDDEAFHVDLSSAVNTTLIGGHGTGTIVDDDPSVSAAIDDVTVTEGNLGQTAATFTVSLSGASGRAITVVYATADGTARAPGDYGSRNGHARDPRRPDQRQGSRWPSTATPRTRATRPSRSRSQAPRPSRSPTPRARRRSGTTMPPDHSPAPVLSALRLGPSAFRSAPSGKSGIINPKPRTSGSTVSFTLNEQATVTFRVVHVLTSRGRLSGGKCRARTRANAQRKKRDVQRPRSAGRSGRPAKAGANSFGFSGWVGGKRLGRGSYRLVANDHQTPRATRRSASARTSRFADGRGRLHGVRALDQQVDRGALAQVVEQVVQAARLLELVAQLLGRGLLRAAEAEARPGCRRRPARSARPRRPRRGPPRGAAPCSRRARPSSTMSSSVFPEIWRYICC